ncbi:MAG: FAD-dependent oxidoreductase [Polyangiaceae bacterium]
MTGSALLMRCERHDVVVVGAGPAGLSAAAALAEIGVDVLLCDRGDSLGHRDRYDPVSMLEGVGGAGLYSDGKFSFEPSASGLRQHCERALLDVASTRVFDRLTRYGLHPLRVCPDDRSHRALSSWTSKRYPSEYLSLEARSALTSELFSTATQHVSAKLRARLVSIEPRTDSFCLMFAHDARRLVIEARHVVLALGRFAPLSLDSIQGSSCLSRVFRRVEIGVRLEDRADASWWSALDGLDPKLLFEPQDRAFAFRTFCCCRNGEVVKSTADSIHSVSGRADCPPSGRSNIGLNVRLLDSSLALQALSDVLNRAKRAPIALPLAQLLDAGSRRDALESVLGPMLTPVVIEALERFVGQLPALPTSEAMVHAPAIEGLGLYPDLDPTLESGSNLWVAGDATGIFRGIVAALISGEIVAHAVARSLLRVA